MSADIGTIWVYLAATPLLGLTLTLLAYLAGAWLHRRARCHALVSPVLIAVALLVCLLQVTGTSYATYFQGAQFVHFLLGPATVALAVPLYDQFHRIRRSLPAIGVSVLGGGMIAAVTAAAVAWLLGASARTTASLAPKSVTTPIAMAISERLGGLPSLTAVLVIVTGILGAVCGSLILDLIRVRDAHARGLALGVAAHGIGTARAFQEGSVAGAFAGLGMGLNGLITAILLPLLYRLVM